MTHLFIAIGTFAAALLISVRGIGSEYLADYLDPKTLRGRLREALRKLNAS